MSNVFKTKDGKWKIDLKIRVGKSKKRLHVEKRGFPSEAAARRSVEALKSSSIEKYDNRHEDDGFLSLLDDYLRFESTRKRLSSSDADNDISKAHLRPRWSGKTIDQAFSIPSIQGFRTYLNDLKVGTKRKNVIICWFIRFSDWSFRQNRITADQCRLVTNSLVCFRDDANFKNEKIALTKDQYVAFINTFSDDDKYKAMFELWFFLGCRIGEMMDLQWKDVDFEKKIIRIYKQSVYLHQEKRWIDAPTKSKLGNRDIPLTEKKVSMLKDFKESRQLPKTTDFLFFSGHHVTNHAIVNQLRKHCLLADIPVISPHEIRHTVASWIALSCHDYGDVVRGARWLGHSVSEFSNTYCHNLKDEASLAKAIDI